MLTRGWRCSGASTLLRPAQLAGRGQHVAVLADPLQAWAFMAVPFAGRKSEVATADWSLF